MNTSHINPFRPTRWEHHNDGYQLIWFTSTAELLADDKSVYVRGSRGSGKTTLLKSICWEDLSKNESLMLQKKISDFKHIGIYIRFSDHINSIFDSGHWKNASSDQAIIEKQFHTYFSLLVELTCIEKLLDACHELRMLGNVTYLPANEFRIVEEIFSEYPSLVLPGRRAPKTFIQAARDLRNLTRLLNAAALRGAMEAFTPFLPEREPGEILFFAGRLLSNAIELNSNERPRRASFKFCLDDCEVLNLDQQKSLNTLVRTTKSPISWVVSSVGAFYESAQTFIPQQPLTDADRTVISLDQRDDRVFRELCQAVVSLRLFFAVREAGHEIDHSTSIADFFPLRKKLSERNVNGIMSAMAKTSQRETAKHLISAAKILSQHQPARKSDPEPGQETVLPFYKAYLLLLWQGKGEAFKTSFDINDLGKLEKLSGRLRNPSFDAWLRRKQRAAMLHFASVLSYKRIPLCGSNIIISLSDGSIRDFLEILGYIYEAYVENPDKIDPQPAIVRFSASVPMIPKRVQTQGIYNASSAYLEGVSARAQRKADVVLRLIEGLGHYTGLLQSSADDPSVLGRAERGVIQVKFSKVHNSQPGKSLNDREQIVWDAIRLAEISGYLRTDQKLYDSADGEEGVDPSGKTISFRLHRRFAPNFGFSFRGALEPVVVSPEELWRLCDATSGVTSRTWAEQTVKRLSQIDESQLILPLSDAYDD